MRVPSLGEAVCKGRCFFYSLKIPEAAEVSMELESGLGRAKLLLLSPSFHRLCTRNQRGTVTTAVPL